MSLDIAVLDDQGAPVHGVAVSAESHFQLMRQAESLQLRQLSRLHDYYEDVDYTAQETQLLQQETQELARECSGRPEFCALINEIESLVHLAVNNNKSVVAIAD